MMGYKDEIALLDTGGFLQNLTRSLQRFSVLWGDIMPLISSDSTDLKN